MRFAPMLLMFMGIALFSAMVMPPDLANGIRKVDLLFAPVASPVHRIAGAVSDRFSSGSAARSAEDRNTRQLEDKLDELNVKLASLTVQYEEAERQLGEMGTAGREVSSLCRMVTVIGSIPNRQMLSLEGSSVQGLAADMPVLSPHGIVGKLDMVGAASAAVLLVSDPTMSVRVDFRGERPGQNGFVRLGNLLQVARGSGDGGLIISGLKLPEFKAAGLQVGDMVALNDSDWPAALQGYKVGTIEEIKDGTSSLYVDLVVRPYDELMKLHNVMVMVRGH